METELLTPDEAGLQKAAGLIREGQVVGMPTETVYGLAADATNRDAVAKVFAAKGRPMDNPLIVHISSMEELEQAVSRVPELVASLADAFWPGADALPPGGAGIDPHSRSAHCRPLRKPIRLPQPHHCTACAGGHAGTDPGDPGRWCV